MLTPTETLIFQQELNMLATPSCFPNYDQKPPKTEDTTEASKAAYLNANDLSLLLTTNTSTYSQQQEPWVYSSAPTTHQIAKFLEPIPTTKTPTGSISYSTQSNSLHQDEMLGYLSILFPSTCDSTSSDFAPKHEISNKVEMMPPSQISTRSTPTSIIDFNPTATSSSTSSKISILSHFLPKYWKNGRKNLQCFPFCPEHEDFYKMKLKDLKHQTPGVCRSPVHVFIDTCDYVDPSKLHSYVQHERLIVLGKFEQYPTNSSPLNEQQQFEYKQNGDSLLPPFQEFSTKEDLNFFKTQCYEATLDMNNSKSWIIQPDVWKVFPALKKKRKATRNAPGLTFPFCFRVMVYLWEPKRHKFICVQSCHSSAFELFSTRTIDRIKRQHDEQFGVEDCIKIETRDENSNRIERNDENHLFKKSRII